MVKLASPTQEPQAKCLEQLRHGFNIKNKTSKAEGFDGTLRRQIIQMLLLNIEV